jgi:hypothetical protein
VIAITTATRIYHVRDLALPVWVDPVHHVAIVRLIVNQGAVPPTFDPFIPAGIFNYHWGFHSLVAWNAWLLGITDPFALADLVLHLGQLLNVLTVPMFYAAGRVLFASRRAGLFTAVIVGLVSWFPAYFLSWGRYTHLAGVLLMAPMLLTLWKLRTRPQPGVLLSAILLLAGLGLMHVRVLFLSAILGSLLALFLIFQRRWQTVLWWMLAATIAVLLTLPWWLWLWQSTWVRMMVAVNTDTGAVWANYNLPNWGLVWAPRNSLLIALATMGISTLSGWQEAVTLAQMMAVAWLLLLVGLGIWSWRRPMLRQFTQRIWLGWLLLLLWVAISVLLLQLNRFGLPSMRFIHINSGIITLFAPLGLAVGGLLAWAIGLLAPPRFARYVAGIAILSISVWGASGMTTILNPVTILATPADRAALIWVRDHTPTDAHFIVNSWEWLSGIYVGSDGGYWIPILTSRSSILLPVQYAGTLPTPKVQAMNELFRQLATTTNLDDPSIRMALATQNVTHLYLGARQGSLRPEQIDGKPYANLIYRKEGVSIYTLDFTR